MSLSLQIMLQFFSASLCALMFSQLHAVGGNGIRVHRFRGRRSKKRFSSGRSL